MRWRAWSAAAILGVAAGCTSPEEMSRAPVLPGDSTPHPPPPTPIWDSEDDAALENWRTSVLDRADADTMDLIRKHIETSIRRLQDDDVRLSYLPPGIAIEERTRIASRIAFEKKRLALVEER